MNYRSKAPRANKIVKAIEEAGGKAVAVQADVTKAEDLQTPSTPPSTPSAPWTT